MLGVPIPIVLNQTFTPTTDNTPSAAGGYTSMDKIRFFNGRPQTIGGWESVTFSSNTAISGVCRMLYSQFIGNLPILIAGTHTKLFSVIGSELTNITPLVTSTTALANNPLTTYFQTLSNPPFTTVNGSQNVTVAYASHRFVAGDIITMAGAATTNGIPAGDFNTNHVVRSVTTNAFVITTNTAATSGGTGGGAAATVGSGLITVAQNAHGFASGDRIKILGAGNVGGIVAATHINFEHIIRNISINAYDIMTGGSSTSAATAGGAAVTVQGEIADGSADASTGTGYSAGLYSEGEYGSALTSSTTNIKPRIWSAGAYGARMIMTPGGQTGVYEWDGVITAAPVLVSNAPAAVNYVFVDREIVITLGASNTGNRVKTSDRGNRTTWTGSAQNEVFEDDIEGAATFITHATVNGINVLFTANQAYTMIYRGKPAIWEIKQKLQIGIIAQNARVVVNNVCYFMSEDNLYSFDGSTLTPLLTDNWRKYLFGDINRSQSGKCVLSYHEQFNEIAIRWPSSGSSEIDSYMLYNIKDGTAAAGLLERTAEEYPFSISTYQRAIEADGTLFIHEYGVNDDGAAMDWHLETCYVNQEKDVLNIYGVYPDSIQTGDITVTCTTYEFPQSTVPISTSTLTISPTTEEAPFDNTLTRGRLHKYRLEGNELNGSWRAGAWQEKVDLGTPRV